ncbi:MAG: cation:proton antiporter [Methanosarcinales archaeon]|nr:cation:proton antiporter [Methanosarcinales archaeon]
MGDSVYLLALLALIFLMGISAHILGRFFRMPSIVFLLFFGIILGPEVLNVINTSGFEQELEAIVAISVAIIVFDGGLNINLNHIRTLHKSILKIISIGVLTTFIGATFVSYYLINIPIEMSLLYGALVSATGPTVITPMVKQVHVNRKISKILEAEGVLNDPISVILSALVFEWILLAAPDMSVVHYMIIRVGAGIIIGLVGGIMLAYILQNIPLITAQYARLITLTTVLLSFAIAESFGNGSGILAVAILAFIIGSTDIAHKESIKEFKGDLVIILLSFIFILLAGMIKLEYIWSIGIPGLFVILILLFVIRPAAVFASTSGSLLTVNDKAFISFIAPRGVVPASMVTYFAIRMKGIEGMGESVNLLVGLVFLTVIFSVLMPGIFAGTIAKKLEVIPMEIIIIGGGGVGRELAQRFDKRGENVVVIDPDEDDCQKVMELGIKVVQGDGNDLEILEKAGIKNAKYIIATTDKDNVNLLSCQISKSKYGFSSEQLIARVNDPHNLPLFTDLGIRSMSPIISAAIILENMVGRNDLFTMCEVGNEGDIIEVRVTNPKVVGHSIRNINLPTNSLIVLIRRGDDSMIAHSDTILEDGDHVTIIGQSGATVDAASLIQ